MDWSHMYLLLFIAAILLPCAQGIATAVYTNLLDRPAPPGTIIALWLILTLLIWLSLVVRPYHNLQSTLFSTNNSF